MPTIGQRPMTSFHIDLLRLGAGGINTFRLTTAHNCPHHIFGFGPHLSPQELSPIWSQIPMDASTRKFLTQEMPSHLSCDTKAKWEAENMRSWSVSCSASISIRPTVLTRNRTSPRPFAKHIRSTLTLHFYLLASPRPFSRTW